MDAVFDKSKVLMFLAVALAVSILVVVAIMLDLWDGVHTARKTGERVHSHKLRVTIAKVCEYWRFVLIGFLVDCLGLLFSFYVLPFVTVVFGAGLIAVEAKSMFEHASRRKSHAADLGDIVQSILVCSHEHDARKLVDIIVNKGTNQHRQDEDPEVSARVDGIGNEGAVAITAGAPRAEALDRDQGDAWHEL